MDLVLLRHARPLLADSPLSPGNVVDVLLAGGSTTFDILAPGVLAKAILPSEQLGEAVLAGAHASLAELTQSRQREGAKLAQFMLERVARMEALVEQARPRFTPDMRACPSPLAWRRRAGSPVS